MYDRELYREFYSLIESCISNHLEYLKGNLENSDFLYGDASLKLKIIEELINNEKTFDFNHHKAKGVIYNGGTPELVKSEIEELINYCGVNLEHTKYGLFNSKHDIEKPPAYKSKHQFLLMIQYALTIQFYTIEKEKIKIGYTEFENQIFNDAKSQKFFENEIVNKWLIDEKNIKTALSYAFRRMKNYPNEEPFTSLKIICKATFFVSEYWNIRYPHILKIDNPKNPKFEKSKTINPQPYCAIFERLENDFLMNYIKIN